MQMAMGMHVDVEGSKPWRWEGDGLTELVKHTRMQCLDAIEDEEEYDGNGNGGNDNDNGAVVGDDGDGDGTWTDHPQENDKSGARAGGDGRILRWLEQWSDVGEEGSSKGAECEGQKALAFNLLFNVTLLFQFVGVKNKNAAREKKKA